MALDIAGYHSPPPDKNEVASSGSQIQVTFSSTNTDELIPFPRSKPSIPSHLQTSFPARRSVSDSPDDITPRRDTLTAEGGDASLPVQGYSWEWGGFPQPSPLQGHFTSSGLMVETDDTRPEVDEDEPILKRSRSVPPELEGSPHTIRSPLPHDDDDDDEASSRPSVHEELGEYKDGESFGRITARHDDQTKFQVWLDGTSIAFELSLVPSLGPFHSGDETESAHTFEQGIIDYARMMGNENLVQDERLVMRWTDRQYITREERSPLMDSLQQWVSATKEDRLAALPSPPSSPSLSASPTEEEPISSPDVRGEPKRAESEPREVLTRKSTSSWVRWWSRSRDILDSERPVLRETAAVPLDQVDVFTYR